MAAFESFTLDNGLKVMFLPDKGNPMAVVNIMYHAGSRDEQADKTGFAHLFEHLMFGGSVNIPVFDEPLQRAGGENNAFTNTDITNYYIQLPVKNIETAFWLESDRMMSLAFSQKSLDVQKGVVVEEFKQRCLNQPYGDAMHHLRALAYEKHPYRWPTIGEKTEHIEEAELKDVKQFFYTYYRPNNAVMVVAGDLDFQLVQDLSEKWFGLIEAGPELKRNLPQEDPQTKNRRKTVKGKVPMRAIYKAYPMAGRMSEEFYAANLLTDILGHGKSSRLVDKLVNQERIFHSLGAYVTGSADPGLLILEGKVNEGFTAEQAENRLTEEIERLKKEGFDEEELQKVKNQAETSLAGTDVELLHRAINLAYFTLLGDPHGFEKELDKIQAVGKELIESTFARLIRPENENTLIYETED